MSSPVHSGFLGRLGSNFEAKIALNTLYIRFSGLEETGQEADSKIEQVLRRKQKQ